MKDSREIGLKRTVYLSYPLESRHVVLRARNMMGSIISEPWKLSYLGMNHFGVGFYQNSADFDLTAEIVEIRADRVNFKIF